MDTNEAVIKLKEIQNGLPLRISRTPPETLEKFKNLANKHFCGDYGMALDFLVRNTEIAITLNSILVKLNDFEQRVEELEKKKRRMLDGSTM